MRKPKLLLTMAAALAVHSVAFAGPTEDAVCDVILKYLPGTYGFAKPKVESVEIDDAAGTVTVKCNESTAYIPLDAEAMASLKQGISAALPADKAGYKIVLLADGADLDELVLFSPARVTVAPTEDTRFVTRTDNPAAPKGLDGNNIAVWQSHGRYYDQGSGRWSWQRPRLWETCEDLYTQGYVIPFLMPMLENAGAYVMSPRERDIRSEEYIIDGDMPGSGYTEISGSKAWSQAPGPGFYHDGKNLVEGINPFKNGHARMVETVKKNANASASWNTDIDVDGDYAVYVSYQSLPNSATDAVYIINAANGEHKVKVNQRMGGGTWIYLGHFPFKKGKSAKPLVEIFNQSSDAGAVVTADAVKIGGGMGNVARKPLNQRSGVNGDEYTTSGYPRFDEGSRYWLQWAGAPDSVYSQTKLTNDYTDDYCSRGHWVNWMTGGSSVLPDRPGLGVPIDLSFAFHTDAGITKDDSVIGTLGIYTTNGWDTYPNGTSRLAARDLTDLVLTNTVDDVRATFNPNWTRRGMWNRNYAESRVPNVPGMLLEFLSHQNFADMQYGLDPAFRFVVSRGIYKGMLQFLAHRDGRPYVVQPLPVRAFAITAGDKGKYTLTWEERVDTLEATAKPTYYLVEERVGDGVGFTRIAKVNKPKYEVKITDNEIHSYRIIAGNDGGVSFPSEVLALCHKPDAPTVMVVNGFTRVSAPGSFDYGEAAGFTDDTDPGVPYLYDISYVGPQFEYRRDISWMANEVAGLGASRSDYEDVVVAGNTFDYVAVHGRSIVDAGYGFISSSLEAFENTPLTGDRIAVVDLILGNQKETMTGTGHYGTRYKTFTAPLQDRLRQYTAEGGNVMVSGAYIATDLWNNPYSSEETAKADREFANQVLGYRWTCGNATKRGQVEGIPSRYEIFDDVQFRFNNTLNSECYAAVAPDAIAPADKDKGQAILRYVHTDMTAGTAYVGDEHRAVVIGVPFETITTASARNTLMSDILKFLTTK